MNSAQASSLKSNGTPAAAENCLTELDARGATPPDLLPAILAAMASIPDGRLQFVRTPAEPVELLNALLAQGVSAEARSLSDGSWRTALRRPLSTAFF